MSSGRDLIITESNCELYARDLTTECLYNNKDLDVYQIHIVEEIIKKYEKFDYDKINRTLVLGNTLYDLKYDMDITFKIAPLVYDCMIYNHINVYSCWKQDFIDYFMDYFEKFLKMRMIQSFCEDYIYPAFYITECNFDEPTPVRIPYLCVNKK